MLLSLWESVIVLCFVVRYFIPILVLRLFLAVPRGCLQFVIVVFPDHTHLLILKSVYLELRFSVHIAPNTTSNTLNNNFSFLD